MTASTHATVALPPSISPDLTRRLGGLVASDGVQRASVTHVFTGEPLTDVPASSTDDVARAVAAARAAQPAWAATPVRQRAAVLRRFAELVHQETELIADLIQAETGKARMHALLEQLDPLLTATYYARKARGLLKPRRRAGMFPGVVSAVERRTPKGVVGIISPWNFPFALGLNDALAALVAGNAVVLKPDTQTCLSPLYGAELLRRAGLPDGVLQVVVGDGPVVGRAIVEQADYVGFTGSSATGRDVAQRSGARLVGCSLELGGKNPMLVLDDADLDRAVTAALSGSFTNAGQLCISIERIYVDRRLHEEFLSRFAAAASALAVGASYTDLELDMGSLTSARQLETVSAHVADAVARGADVVAGGKARPDLGPYFFEPTVLTGVTEEMACHSCETFGPVVAVYPVADEAEAVARANDTEYGLNASVFTRSARRGQRVAAAIRAGTVNVNDTYSSAYGSMDAPMGGMGASGLGRRHGAEGLLKYTEAQNVAHARFSVVDPPPQLSRSAYLRLSRGAVRWLGRARIR